MQRPCRQRNMGSKSYLRPGQALPILEGPPKKFLWFIKRRKCRKILNMRKKSKMIVGKSAFFQVKPISSLRTELWSNTRVSKFRWTRNAPRGCCNYFLLRWRSWFGKKPLPSHVFWSRIIVIFNFTKHLSLGKRSSKVRKCKAAKMNWNEQNLFPQQRALWSF